MRRHSMAASLAALATLALSTGTAAAQSAPHAGWEHTAAFYVVAAGMSGTQSIGALDADVDLSASEIFDHLEAGGMAAYRGTNGTWSVMVNSMFIGLGATKDGRLGGSAEVDIDQTLLEVDGGWRFAKHLELYYGVRYAKINADVEVRPAGGSSLTGSDGEHWFDPLVGLRYETPIGPKWTFVGRADVGGFGVGSDLAWQAMAHFDWQIGKHWGAAFGYVALDMDYETGDGADFFHYDILGAGPFAAVTYRF